MITIRVFNVEYIDIFIVEHEHELLLLNTTMTNARYNSEYRNVKDLPSRD